MLIESSGSGVMERLVILPAMEVPFLTFHACNDQADSHLRLRLRARRRRRRFGAQCCRPRGCRRSSWLETGHGEYSDSEQTEAYCLLERTVTHGSTLRPTSRGACDPCGVRALARTGAGQKAFSARADIQIPDGVNAAPTAEQMRRGKRALDRVIELLVVAAGASYGVAYDGEFAIAADVPIAGGSRAHYGLPEITLEHPPGRGGSQALPRTVGLNRTSEIILIGEVIDSERVLPFGLVDRVEPAPIAAAVELTDTIGSGSAVAVSRVKREIHVHLDDGMRAGRVVETGVVAARCETSRQRPIVDASLGRKRSMS